MSFNSVLFISYFIALNLCLGSCLNSSFQFEFKISYIHDLIKNGTKCSEIIDYFLNRAYEYNSKLNAIISFNHFAKAEAIILDSYYENNKKLYGALHCVPILLKDNIDLKGIPSTGGIKAFRNLIPNKDASIVESLKNNGGIVIAKTNLGELATSILESEVGGLCKNPYDLNRTCGGSSSGSAAGIAAGFGVISIGTDTCGSIINPSDFNGVYGLRPSLDKSKLDGIIPLSKNLDTVGPITKYLDDLVLTYSIINEVPSIYEEFKKNTIPQNLTIGVISELSTSFVINASNGNIPYDIDTEKQKAFNKAIKLAEDLEINVKRINLSDNDLSIILKREFLMFDTSCVDSCRKLYFNSYLADVHRYGPDAPYHNYEDVLNSPLLSNHWRRIFNRTNVQDPQKQCVSNCVNFEQSRLRLKGIMMRLFNENKVDAFAFVSTAILPIKHDHLFNGPILFSLIAMSAVADFPSINVPVAFSTPSNDAPNGLPIGLFLISREDTLVNAFRIAKLLENSAIIAVLPHTVPFLKERFKDSCDL